MDRLPVEFTPARVNINLIQTKPASPLPGKASDPKCNQDGECQIGLEKAFGVINTVFARRCDRREELMIG